MLECRVYQNNNKANEKTFGRYYGRVTHNLMEFDDFVQYLANHNCVFPEGVIHGALIEMSRALRELVLDGKAVRLGELGIFSIGAATEGTAKPTDFSADNIKRVRLNLQLGRRSRADRLFDDAKFREAKTYMGTDTVDKDPAKEEGGENAHTGEGDHTDNESGESGLNV